MKQIAYAVIIVVAVAVPALSRAASAQSQQGPNPCAGNGAPFCRTAHPGGRLAASSTRDSGNLSSGCLTAQGVGTISALPAAQRALASWRALVRWFGNWSPRYPNVFADHLPGRHRGPNYVWGQGQVVHAAVFLAKLTRDYRAFNCIEPTLSRYLLSNKGTTGYAPPIDPGRSIRPPARWWDDNGVTALALLQAYAQLGDPKYLQSVRNLWPFFKAGQRKSGGERENEDASHPAFSTVATGSVDQSVERLDLTTKSATYLQFLLTNDAWVKTTLRAPRALYWDGYYPNIAQSPYKWCDGRMTHGVCSGTLRACEPRRRDLPSPQVPSNPHICAWTWPQNQGMMIGSDVLLYRMTSNRQYLGSATRTAHTALRFYPLKWLWKTPPWTNSVYFEGLFQLDQYVHDPRIRAALKAYLDRAWSKGRDPRTGLFNRGGIGIENSKIGISSLDQSAWVVMYSLLASSTPAPKPHPRATRTVRAMASYAALQKYLYLGNRHVLARWSVAFI